VAKMEVGRIQTGMVALNSSVILYAFVLWNLLCMILDDHHGIDVLAAFSSSPHPSS